MNGTRSAYIDSEGKPLLRHSVSGFLDVLGFSHLSIRSTDRAETQHTLDQVAAAIRDSRNFARDALGDSPLADPSRWSLKFFSDNLVFGFPIDAADTPAGEVAWLAVRCMQRYQLRMALGGYFVRGAASAGDVCLTDEIIFGPVLIECYRLESKASIVPRVVLTDPLQELLHNTLDSFQAREANASHAICRDIDGWWFINYLDVARTSSGIDWALIARHKTSVLASLAGTTQHDVLPKFGWACRYHNVFCHWHRDDPHYSESYRIDRTDERSTIHRLADSSST
jgi:hypothetical protein